MTAPRLQNLMTPFPHAIDLSAPIGEARRLMLELTVRHLPVTRNDELKGLISDRDIKLLLGPELGSPDPKDLTVEDAYVEDCYVVDQEQPLAEVLHAMADQHVGAAVVTHQGRLVGIFTTTDACRAFADYLDAQVAD